MYKLIYYKNGDAKSQKIESDNSRTLADIALDFISEEFSHTDVSFAVYDDNGVELFNDEDLNND